MPVYGPPHDPGARRRAARASTALLDRARLVPVEPRRAFDVGGFRVEPIRVTHSIVDGIGYGIDTPVGTVVHTGDFKFDPNPIDGERSDYHRLRRARRARRPLPLLGLHERRPAGHHALRARGRPGAGATASAAPRAASSSRRSPRTSTASSRSSTSPPPSAGRSRCSGGAWRPTCAIAAELGYLRVPDGVAPAARGAGRAARPPPGDPLHRAARASRTPRWR